MLARVNLTRTARALAAAPLGTAAIAATSSSSLAAATASHTPAPRKRARLATPLQAARAFATTRAVHNGDALANANIFASSPDERVSVTSLTPSAGFTLSDGLVVPSPVLLIDGACFLWDVSHPTEGKGKNPMGFDWDGWTREKMQIFEALSPRPEILLVGTGTSTMFAPPAFKKYLNGLGIQVDVLDSRNAASTYNLLQEEGRRVAAALYPVSHLSARTGLVASTQPLLQRTRDKRIALPVRVEPKVFFANERTFLSWLNFTVVLGGLAVGLLNFGDRVGKISAGMFTLVAMSIMAYALVTYHWRANAIRKRGSGPYDDRLGPTVLCLALFAAVVTNFILRFTAA